MAEHRLEASPDTVHWGYFDAALKPLVTIDVRRHRHHLDGLRRAGAAAEAGLRAHGAARAAGDPHRACRRSSPARTSCTGPVAVRGAKAGQVLEVRIKDIQLHYDWGYNAIRPLAGALPDDFKEMRLIHIPLDRARMVGTLSWGAGDSAEAVLRHHGGGAAGRLGPGRLAAAAQERRQHGQQGTGRRHHALPADPCRRRAVLLRRRPRRAGRRRGLHHRDRDRPDRHLRAASCAPT